MVRVRIYTYMRVKKSHDRKKVFVCVYHYRIFPPSVYAYRVIVGGLSRWLCSCVLLVQQQHVPRADHCSENSCASSYIHTPMCIHVCDRRVIIINALVKKKKRNNDNNNKLHGYLCILILFSVKLYRNLWAIFSLISYAHIHAAFDAQENTRFCEVGGL